MSNIQIFMTPDFLSTTVPTECIPKRFAIATNILLCAFNKGLLLFNYEPEKWNQWYPYFSSVNDMYEFKGATYEELVKDFKSHIMPRADVQARLEKAQQAFLNLLGVHGGEIKFCDSPIAPEMWLKYSKTQNIWTFYYMEFLQVQQLPTINFESLDSNVVDFMPLVENTIHEAVETGKYRGIEVVDNTIAILKNRENLSKLLSGAISI